MAQRGGNPRAQRGGRTAPASSHSRGQGAARTASGATARGGFSLAGLLGAGGNGGNGGNVGSGRGGNGNGNGTRGGRGRGDVAVRNSSRTFWVLVLFLAAAFVFLLRLVYLQVIVAPEYSAMAQASRTVGFSVQPQRGTIYDRNGNILAISVDATTVYANPSEITEPGTTARVIAEALGGTPADYMDALVGDADTTFAFVKRRADVDAAEALRQQELPGIYFLADTRREYPYGQVGGQVVGCVSVEVDEEANEEYYVGTSGLELYYDQILSGTPGYYEAEIGADGTPIPGGVHVSTPAVEGQDIVVSLDIEFQEEVEKALVLGLKRVAVPNGTAVVMDASNGEIYAACSTPYFNPADRTTVKEGAMQLKAVSSLFEPGSIFKAVSITAVLENGVYEPDDEIFCPAQIEADGYIVSDAYDRGDVTWPLRTIIAMSSNVGVSMATEKMGFDKLYEAILKYNLDKPTGVDYPGEQPGYLLDFDHWSRVQGYNVAFGQGISVNAMQMVRFYGALENGGVEVVPHFLIRKPQTGEVAEYPTERVITNRSAVPKMVEMLRGVVTEGTGTLADIEGYKVVGKTSTGEIYDEENGGYRVGVYTIAFTGFIADSSSDLVCFVSADEVPGDRVMTPCFKDIMTCAINRYNIVQE